MKVKQLIKKTAETLMYGPFPYSIMRHVPQGFEFYFDLRKYRSDYKPKVVFDVGANTGQTVLKWNRCFPGATYYCFEPVSETMATLKKNTSRLKNVRYFNCALGAEKSTAEIVLCKDSSLNSFVDEVKQIGERSETVRIETLDEICQQEGITHIDVLKIDTEGFDIEVLKGAGEMLYSNRITFIQVEAGMNPANRLHKSLQDFVEYLTPFGYVLFGVYEQHLEWTGEKRLSFSNPVFICEKVAMAK